MTKSLASAAQPSAPDDALQDLVDRGVLSTAQLEAVRRALRKTAPAQPSLRDRVPWTEIAGYLGGALVLTGAVLLVATSWNRLTEPARTGLVGACAAILLIAGVAAAGGPVRLWSAREATRNARQRVAGALLALGAGTTAIAVNVALPDDALSWGVATSAAVGLVVAAGGYALLPTVFGVVASIVLLVVMAMSGMDAIAPLTPLSAGLTLLVTGLLVAALALGRVLEHRLIGLAAGAGIALFGAQQPLGQDGAEPWAYLLTFALGGALLLLYRSMRNWIPLVLGVVAVALAVPEAIQDLTDGAIGGAAIPLIAGLILLLASGIGLRAHRGRTPSPGG